jgi:hypothetical protein
VLREQQPGQECCALLIRAPGRTDLRTERPDGIAELLRRAAERCGRARLELPSR